MQTILATGVAGFIGSSFLRQIPKPGFRIIALDKLTYAGHRENIEGVPASSIEFIQGDIGDSELVGRLLTQYQPIAVVNFAAESHVDNSISGPKEFINTNIVGVFNLLEASRAYWNKLNPDLKKQFRFSLN